MADFTVNLVPKLLEFLRLQPREEFGIMNDSLEYLDGVYCFDRDDGLLVWNYEAHLWERDVETEKLVLNGTYIIHTNWKPKQDELYWYIKDVHGTPSKREFDMCTFYDCFLTRVSNCFPTKEAAEMARKFIIPLMEQRLDALEDYVPPVLEEEVEDVVYDFTTSPCGCGCCKNVEDEEEKNTSTDEKNT